MAAATRPPRPGRALAVVGLFVVGLYLGVGLGPSHTPQLGLDLRGGTSAVLTARTPGNRPPSKASLDEAVNIIRQRVNGLGVAGALVQSEGSDIISVSVPGKGRDQVVRAVGQTAQLRFRLVLAEAASTPALTPSPSPSGPPRPSPTAARPGRSSAPRVQPRASTSARALTGTAGALFAGFTEPTAGRPARPAATRPTPRPTGTARSGATPRPTASPSAAASNPLTAYADLDCAKTPNPTGGTDQPNQEIVACSQDASTKFLLGPATVLGTMVTNPQATLDPTSNQWLVTLDFNNKGTSLWAKLTTQASGLPAPGSGCGPPNGCNAIAVVLDGVVVSAPTVNNGPILGGNTQITGNFTQQQANALADELRYGALPLHFDLSSVESVSATLGSDQLRGGLIAGAIGLGLVVLFSLVYYRGLGLVTIASLLLSGTLLYALVTILGETAFDYTLSLAGIAGFIVAVGITADSFVVFFERLRDEVREGRTLRSAVERAWPRARRTILSADTVSLLAAVILYWLSIGDVRGFAFTLGLSTICDLFIVFLFTKPLLTLLMRTRLYGSGGAFSGLASSRRRRAVAAAAVANRPVGTGA